MDLILKTIHRHRKHVLILMMLLVNFPGCTGRMTLDEAKKVTISVGGEAFVPPPRRINDILAILDHPGLFDVAITARFKVKARLIPPENADTSRQLLL